ncbi:MAG: hypothetical protein C0412_11645 [Flavobacterium sp.]|nr:hypothetical protein [Flavobacterium sp.]
MDEAVFVDKVIHMYFPFECEIVGPTNVEDIISGSANFIAPTNSSNMDLAETLQLLAVATSFIKIVIDIYNLLRKDKKSLPTKYEISVHIEQKINNIYDINSVTKDFIISDVVDFLEENNNDGF